MYPPDALMGKLYATVFRGAEGFPWSRLIVRLTGALQRCGMAGNRRSVAKRSQPVGGRLWPTKATILP
jgi:hypothetical protein